MDPQYILGVDIGSSSVRAALYNVSGELVPKTLVKRERRLESKKSGGAEIDADEALKQVVDVIDEVLRRSESTDGVIAYVAASSFWHSLVGIDANGNPTTKVFGWADNQSRDYVRIFRRRFDEAEIHNRTGARFHSSYWPAKLLWLREEFPEVWKNTDRWLSFSDYIALKFFGTPVTSVSMASGTGIFDIRQCDWDAKLLHFLKLGPVNLPEIVSSDAAALTLITRFAKRWQRLSNSLWFPAIGDGAANNIGSGCIGKSRVALMVGTSAAMRVAYKGDPPDEIPPGLWCYRIDRKRVVIGGALSDGGGLYQWLKETLRLEDNAEAEIAKRPPSGHGLTFLPFIAGERGTGYNENASGAIIGLNTSTDAIDILQAAMESVAYRFAEIYDQLNRVCHVRDIIASGGALRESPVWAQIIADVVGRDLALAAEPEASLHGAALFAIESSGIADGTKKPSSSKKALPPCHRGNHSIYQKALSRHSEMIELLSRRLEEENY